MPSLPPAKLRRVERFAMQMGPDERRLFLLVEFAGGEHTTMGPFDRDALISVIATFGTRQADAAMLVDPETDTIRIAYDGFTDEQVTDEG